MRSGRGVEGGEAAVRGATVPQGEEGGEVDRLVGRPPPLRRAGGPKARREGGRGEGIRGHSRRTEGGGGLRGGSNGPERHMHTQYNVNGAVVILCFRLGTPTFFALVHCVKIASCRF